MVELDSGAHTNLMDEFQYRALTRKSQEIGELRETRSEVKTIQSSLSTIGTFKATVRNKNRGVETKFIVISGRMDSPPLLSKRTSEELGMMITDPNGKLKEENDLKIKRTTPKSLEDILETYQTAFEGIGRIYDTKTGEEIEVTLEIEKDAKSVAQKPRHVPYYLMEPLKDWLEIGIREEIFEKVPKNEAITWCSPVVVLPKPKFVGNEQLKADQIRATIDMRIPNKVMMRSRNVQAPLVEDFAHKFSDCKVFSKLDLRQGYHQLMLSEESRKLATFSTPWGNYRPKRLVFGAKSSQDVFDETMYRIFGNIQRCLNQRDDILIGGRDLEEHNKVLEEVLQKATDFNVTFNRDKCQFATETIDFFGHRFTKDGLQPDPEKVRAVKEAARPETKEAVRSFLGMTGYLDNFIPGYACLTAPLRELTKTKTTYRWGKTEQEAFEKLKKSITNKRTMAYFNPSLQITVRTEASFRDGISAALFQKGSNGRLQPVHFISRSLTDPEKRYSQTEKDALAIFWSKKRFRMYLLGAPRFKIITAHKPLIPMFTKASAKLPPRIEKWVAEMQDVDFEILYEPGKDERDPLDYLSRHPLPETDQDPIEKFVKWTIIQEHAIHLEDIQRETGKDEEMMSLRDRIRNGDWERYRNDRIINQYYSCKEELFEAKNMIFRLDRIILPRSLQRKTIKIAHTLGHLGKTKTKEMLRQKYWFPMMNAMIDTMLDQCLDCQIATKAHKTEPLKMTTIPDEAWHTIAMDFGGPFPDGHYNLVLIDKRSRYPIVEEVSSTAFQPTREAMKRVFGMMGTPRRIETDGGPPFNGREFKEFAAQEGFEHHLVTPEHPRANGEAERFMRVLNKIEKIAHNQTKDKYLRRSVIQDMLIAYRDTPHPATGVTPYHAMQNRQVRTKLDYTTPEKIESEEDRKINKRDERYKEKIKESRENRNTKHHGLVLGDYVLIEQTKKNKWTLPYEPNFYVVTKIEGSKVTSRRVTDGREISRDGSRYKLVNTVMNNDNPNVTQGTDHIDEEDENWREKLFQDISNATDHAPLQARPSGTQAQTSTTPEVITEAPHSNPIPATPTVKIPTPPRARPKRVTRRPAYLKDYV